MELTPEQQAAIERLHDNESLTDNLTDDAAKAVLQFAEQQILAGAPNETVVAAVRAANKTGADSPELALASARSALPATAAVTGDTEAAKTRRKRARAQAEGAVASLASPAPVEPPPAASAPEAPPTPAPATVAAQEAPAAKRPTPWDEIRRWFTGK